VTTLLPTDGRPIRPRRTRKKLDIIDNRKVVYVWADMPDGTRDENAKLDFIETAPDGGVCLCVTFDDGKYILLQIDLLQPEARTSP
jgi:hypothetical protein